MPPRIAMQKFVEGSQNLRQTPWFVEGFAFDKPLSSKFVEKKFVEGSLKVIGSSLIQEPSAIIAQEEIWVRFFVLNTNFRRSNGDRTA